MWGETLAVMPADCLRCRTMLKAAGEGGSGHAVLAQGEEVVEDVAAADVGGPGVAGLGEPVGEVMQVAPISLARVVAEAAFEGEVVEEVRDQRPQRGGGAYWHSGGSFLRATGSPFTENSPKRASKPASPMAWSRFRVATLLGK